MMTAMCLFAALPISTGMVAQSSQVRFANPVHGRPRPGFAYVANRTSNNISAYVINSTSGALASVSVAPFQAGREPIFVVANAKFVFVADLVPNVCLQH
jgi:6-phosphogluconolactonase (cycloisomerase 2 family)